MPYRRARDHSERIILSVGYVSHNAMADARTVRHKEHGAGNTPTTLHSKASFLGMAPSDWARIMTILAALALIAKFINMPIRTWASSPADRIASLQETQRLPTNPDEWAAFFTVRLWAYAMADNAGNATHVCRKRVIALGRSIGVHSMYLQYPHIGTDLFNERECIDEQQLYHYLSVRFDRCVVSHPWLEMPNNITIFQLWWRSYHLEETEEPGPEITKCGPANHPLLAIQLARLVKLLSTYVEL